MYVRLRISLHILCQERIIEIGNSALVQQRIYSKENDLGQRNALRIFTLGLESTEILDCNLSKGFKMLAVCVYKSFLYFKKLINTNQ